MMPGRRALVALSLVAAAPPPTGTLMVDVGNIRRTAGRVHVDVCPQASFLKDNCPYSGEALARAGVTQVMVRGVPAGRYAVQVFHDENANGKVDRALFGIPKEGVGFSRNARISLGPPKWNDAVFAFDGRAGRIALDTRYFLGASGPPKR